MIMNEVIKGIAERLQMGYLYDDWARVNYRSDKREIKYPLLINLLPLSGTFRLNSGYIFDEPNAIFAFVDKARLDFDGEENEGTVEQMKRKALEFIRCINSSGYFEPIGDTDVPYQVLYDKLDVNVTGVSISLRLQPKAGICEDSYTESMPE